MEQELTKIIPERNIPVDAENLFEKFSNFQQIMMIYNCALREVRTKFEVLNDDLSVKNSRNPIEMIKTRIKKPESIAQKLYRKGYDISIDSILTNLNDVAGIRIICSFVDDIYEVSEMFIKQDDVKLIEIKDYIKNPKQNGFRSYHMIVEIPVFFADRKQMVKVEVQFRTIAMDFWASLEHQIKYKKDIEKHEDIIAELKECADTIAETDLKMIEIRKKITDN